MKTSLRELVIIIVQRKKDQRYKDMDNIIRLLSDYEELNKQNMIITIFAIYVHVNFFWDFSMYNYIMHIQWHSKDAKFIV